MFTVRWRGGKKAIGEARVKRLNLRRAFAGTRCVNASRIRSHAVNYLPSHDNAQCYGDLEAVAKLAKENPKNSRIILLAPNDGERLDMEKLVHRTIEKSTRLLGPAKYAFAVHEKPDSTHLMNKHAHVIAVFTKDHSESKLWQVLRREMRIEATKQLGGLQDSDLAVEKDKEFRIGTEAVQHMGEAAVNGKVHARTKPMVQEPVHVRVAEPTRSHDHREPMVRKSEHKPLSWAASGWAAFKKMQYVKKLAVRKRQVADAVASM